jgi:fimbrial chaperone protein
MLGRLLELARTGVVALGLGLVSGPGAARAQPLEVSPIELELTSAAKNGTLTIHNGGTTPLRLQVTAAAWQQGRKGELLLSATRDVTFFPGLLTVAPGEKRNVRVAAAAPFEDVEKTYRVFIEQLPGPPSRAENAIRVRTKIGIPVYLEPPVPAARAELAELARDGARLSFVLRSTGNVRIQPSSVRVVGRDGAGAVVFERPLPTWYVLARGDRAYDSEAPRGDCARVRTVSAEVALGKDTLRAQLPTPGGVCAP